MCNILILGLGAVGTTFASQFYDSNYPLKVLCDADRKDRYLKEGFLVNGKRYDFDYAVKQEIDNKIDILIVAVKYHNLWNVIEEYKSLIGSDTIVLSLLNGIDSEEIINQILGRKEGIYAFVSNIDATKAGNRINYGNKGKIVFGVKGGGISNQIQKLKSIFQKCEINYQVSNNILKDMWWKYMVNMGINQASAVLKVPYSAFQEIEYTKELAEAAMLEVVKVANSIGIDLGQEDIEKAFNMVMKFSPDGKNSMYQDVEAKRKTEVEMFSGKLCELAQINGIEAPVNRMFFNLIKSIEYGY